MEPVDASGPNHKTQKFLENNNKKNRREVFFSSNPCAHPPKSVLERNESENPFDKGVALTSASGHRGPARECWTFRRANVDSCVDATASQTAERMRWRQGGWRGLGVFPPSACIWCWR